MTLQLKYDPKVDAASVLVDGPIVPGGAHYKDRLDADRWVRYSETDGAILQYEFLNVRRFGVRLDDLVHRVELAELFKEAEFPGAGLEPSDSHKGNPSAGSSGRLRTTVMYIAVRNV